MISSAMVRQSCVSHRIHVSRVDGEWRLVCNEHMNTRHEEPCAYYTDDNDDAYMTAVAMRRKYQS